MSNLYIHGINIMFMSAHNFLTAIDLSLCVFYNFMLS